MKEFTKLVNQKLGPYATIDYLTEEICEVETPEFIPYLDQTT